MYASAGHVSRLVSGLALFLVMAIISAPLVYGQFDTAAVLGMVTDPTGAAVPRATVTLRNVGTGVTVTATSQSHPVGYQTTEF